MKSEDDVCNQQAQQQEVERPGRAEPLDELREDLLLEDLDQRQLAAPSLEHLEHELRLIGTVHQPNG